ncbi:MAG: YHS domain-containing (seleno)protein [Pseudomonadota bacterium]
MLNRFVSARALAGRACGGASRPRRATRLLGLGLMSAALWLTASLAHAADRDVFADTTGAVRGVDVVAYHSLAAGAPAVRGDPAITFEYMGATWRFASIENRELFSADPARYAPQYGGYCAFAVSHGFTKSVDPDLWHIVDGKLYLNFNKRADRKWLRNRDAAIGRADSNWPTVLLACEKHDNCNTET